MTRQTIDGQKRSRSGKLQEKHHPVLVASTPPVVLTMLAHIWHPWTFAHGKLRQRTVHHMQTANVLSGSFLFASCRIKFKLYLPNSLIWMANWGLSNMPVRVIVHTCRLLYSSANAPLMCYGHNHHNYNS